MSYFFYVIFLFSIKRIFSKFEYPKESNSEITDIIDQYFGGVKKCFENDTRANNTLFAKCLITEVKKLEPYFYLIQIFKSEWVYSIIRTNLSIDDEFLLAILDVFETSAKNNTGLVDYINEALTSKDSETNLSIFDFMENLIDNLSIEPLNYEYIFGNLSKISQIKGVNSTFYYFFNNYNELFFKFINDTFSKNKNSQIYQIYNITTKYLGKHKKVIIPFLFEFIRKFLNRTEVITLVGEFLKENKDKYDSLKELLKDDYFKELLKIWFGDEKYSILLSIKDIILYKEEALNLFFDLLQDEEIIDQEMGILKNFENNTYLYKNVPLLLEKIRNKSQDYLLSFIKNLMYVSSEYYGRDKLTIEALSKVQFSIRNIFNEKNIDSYNISWECRFLYLNTFLENVEAFEYVLKFVRKFIFDSPMNKGDFMAFDNCLDDKENKNKTSFNFNYTIKPAFVIGIFDNADKLNYTNTSYYDRYHYITNFCVPYAIWKGNSSSMCNQTDYDELVKFLLEFLIDNNNTRNNITTIVLHNDNIKLENIDYFTGIFSLFILLIPIFIRIGLKVTEYILDKKYKKGNKINKLITDKKEKNLSKSPTYDEDESKQNKKPNLSNCHIRLNSYFSFFKNGKELFNFNLNNTTFNNINGITYIKGLIGMSIILNVFGLTFSTLMNIQMKDYGIWHFYRTNQSLLFVFLYIGYRFSPRILFSCSGYTLVYKYLCFIEQEKGLYLLKFIFLQSYKYVFLYFIIIMFRFSIVKIIYIFRGIKRPVWELLRYYLDKENFLTSSFALLFDFYSFNKSEKRQNLVYNFYMPINEIFFFLFGTILITFGYKYKLRIDLFIIAVIIIFFIIKIIIFSTKPNSYSTTDYYTFDFGVILLNPVYNISYFLTGLYFGLINYSIQKGYTSIYKENQYHKYYQLEESNRKSQLEEGKSIYVPLNDNNDDKKDNDENEDEIKEKDENLDKYLSNKEDNINKNKINESENELIEQLKIMPFLKSPIQFYNINKRKKEDLWYKILIFLVIIIMILLCYAKTMFLYSTSSINFYAKEETVEDLDKAREEYRKKISLENVLGNKFLNIINLLDTDIIVILTHWIIFILFFKELTLIREFCNSVYWSFFVKSYFSYLLVSVPIILCILYESESVIKLHIYNFILFSLINSLYIFSFVIVFYCVYEFPFKKIFKSILRGNEIIEEEDEEEENEEEEEEKKDETDEQIMIFEEEEDEEERRSFKNY